MLRNWEMVLPPKFLYNLFDIIELSDDDMINLTLRDEYFHLENNLPGTQLLRLFRWHGIPSTRFLSIAAKALDAMDAFG